MNGATINAVEIKGSTGQATGRVWNANLTRANMRGCDLTSARLNGATMQDTDLSGAKLTGTVLTGADYESATIDPEQLARAILNNPGKSKGKADRE